MNTELYSISTLLGLVEIEPAHLTGETEHLIIHPTAFATLVENRPAQVVFSEMYYSISHKLTGLNVGGHFHNADLAMSAAQALENVPIEWGSEDAAYFKTRLPLAKIRKAIQDRGGTFETQTKFYERIMGAGVILTPEMTALCSR